MKLEFNGFNFFVKTLRLSSARIEIDLNPSDIPKLVGLNGTVGEAKITIETLQDISNLPETTSNQ